MRVLSFRKMAMMRQIANLLKLITNKNMNLLTIKNLEASIDNVQILKNLNLKIEKNDVIFGNHFQS